jgi:hypothetical protein
MIGKFGTENKDIYIGKSYFLNKTIQLWNQQPANAFGTVSCKTSNFR